MGGRGNGAARNTGSAGSTAANKNVEIPKRVTSKNLTDDVYEQIYRDPTSIPVGTIIKDTDDTSFKYRGNGDWLFKNSFNPRWRPLQATVYDNTEVKERIRGALTRLNRSRKG